MPITRKPKNLGRGGAGEQSLDAIVGALIDTSLWNAYQLASTTAGVVHLKKTEDLNATNVLAATDLPSAIALANQIRTSLGGHVADVATINTTPPVLGAHKAADTLNSPTATTPAGTVATTAASGTVTGTGTTFTNYVVGQQIAIGGTTYTISAIGSATSLTISPVAAATASGVTATVSTPVASDLPSTILLANQMKANINAHEVQAGVHFNNDATAALATANATDLPSSLTLLNALKTYAVNHYNRIGAPIYVSR